MKTLGNLKPSKGSNVNKKRVGRGVGSGLGKTSGRGHKGQKARKSSDVPPGFEGGQMPLYRRTPKRGFNNIFREDFEIVNVGALSKLKAGTTVNAEVLKKQGLIRNSESKVKLLGKGDVKVALNVLVNKASASAKAALEKAGGKLELIKGDVEPEAQKKKKAPKKTKKS